MTRVPTTRHSRLLSSISAFTTVAVLASLSATGSQPKADLPSISVHYTTSDLATDKGLRTLYTRIALAAEQVCPPYIYGGISFLREQRIVDSCRQQAIARAIEQIGNPRLAALGRRGTPVG